MVFLLSLYHSPVLHPYFRLRLILYSPVLHPYSPSPSLYILRSDILVSGSVSIYSPVLHPYFPSPSFFILRSYILVFRLRLYIFSGPMSLFSVSVSIYSQVHDILVFCLRLCSPFLYLCFLSPSLYILHSNILVFPLRSYILLCRLRLYIFSVLISLFSFSGLTSLFAVSVSINSPFLNPCFLSPSLYIPWSYLLVFRLRLYMFPGLISLFSVSVSIYSLYDYFLEFLSSF